MDVDDIADQLYALPPGEFTAARDAHVRDLKAGGEKDAAKEVAALRRPTVGAWLANRLVREEREAVDELLELGAALRSAQRELDGAQLRALSSQQHKVVDALVARARKSAVAGGQAVSDEAAQQLTDTLRAALADPQAEAAVRAGRLSTALAYAGFGETSGFAVTAPPRERPDRERTDRERPEDAAARKRLADAERDLAEAQAAHETAEEALAEARAETARARDEVRRLQTELNEALKAQEDAQQREHERSHAVRQAARGLTDAEKLVAQARRKLG